MGKHSARAVLSSLLIVALLTYIFAFLMVETVPTTNYTSRLFGTLTRCMWTLLMDGTFMCNLGETANVLKTSDRSWLTMPLFGLYVLLSAITVMNMLIGVLCDVITTCKQEAAEEEASSRLRSTVIQMLNEADADGNGHISKHELAAVLRKKSCTAILKDQLRIDVGHVLELHDCLYANNDNVV